MVAQDWEPESKERRYQGLTPWLIAAVLVLALTATALAAWGYSEANRAEDLAADVAVAEVEAAALESDLAAATVEVASLQSRVAAAATQGVEPEGWTIADLAAFEAAFESSDYEQVRALFADDGIITTAWNTIGLYYGETSELGTWDVNGSEFRRIATLHGGEEFTVLGTPIQVGNNTVAFGWKWSSGISGTALLHLRDGKIVVAVFNPSQAPIPFQGDS
jgi:hypothetical protein